MLTTDRHHTTNGHHPPGQPPALAEALAAHALAAEAEAHQIEQAGRDLVNAAEARMDQALAYLVERLVEARDAVRHRVGEAAQMIRAMASSLAPAPRQPQPTPTPTQSTPPPDLTPLWGDDGIEATRLDRPSDYDSARLKGYDGLACPACGERTIVSSGTQATCDTCHKWWGTPGDDGEARYVPTTPDARSAPLPGTQPAGWLDEDNVSPAFARAADQEMRHGLNGGEAHAEAQREGEAKAGWCAVCGNGPCREDWTCPHRRSTAAGADGVPRQGGTDATAGAGGTDAMDHAPAQDSEEDAAVAALLAEATGMEAPPRDKVFDELDKSLDKLEEQDASGAFAADGLNEQRGKARRKKRGK